MSLLRQCWSRIRRRRVSCSLRTNMTSRRCSALLLCLAVVVVVLYFILDDHQGAAEDSRAAAMRSIVSSSANSKNKNSANGKFPSDLNIKHKNKRRTKNDLNYDSKNLNSLNVKYKDETEQDTENNRYSQVLEGQKALAKEKHGTEWKTPHKYNPDNNDHKSQLLENDRYKLKKNIHKNRLLSKNKYFKKMKSQNRNGDTSRVSFPVREERPRFISEQLRSDNEAKNNNPNSDLVDSKNKSFTGGDLKTLELELEKRKLSVRKACGMYGLGEYSHPHSLSTHRMRYPPSANYDVLYIDKQDSLTWCPVYKAASTSWLHNFCLLGGIKEKFLRTSKKQISSIARSVWPPLEYEDAEKTVPTTIKFMIVRHPFERLVSAFRDKLENLNIGREHGVQHFYQSYGKKIVEKYRTKDSYNNNTRVWLETTDIIGHYPAPQGIEPTFYEFVKYLIDTDLIVHADDHWIPYYLFCTSCYIDYDVILKFETFDRDQKYLLQRTKLDQKIIPKWLHLTKNRKTSEIVKKYFDTISKSDIRKLYLKYKVDFEMYDYSLDGYI